MRTAILAALVCASFARPARVVPVLVPLPIAVPPTNPRAGEAALVFAVGDSMYMPLDHLVDDPLVIAHDETTSYGVTLAHGPARRIRDGHGWAVIEAVQADDLPPAYRAWLHRELLVDGCRARVRGFAIVARLLGDDGDRRARTIFEHGDPTVVASIDRCTGQLARDAALPPIVVPELVTDEPLAGAAVAALRGSAAAREAQAAWLERGWTGNWLDADEVELVAQVLRHPRTGALWVSVQAMARDDRARAQRSLADVDTDPINAHGRACTVTCQGLGPDVWGLYRVAADRTLIPVEQRRLSDDDELVTIDRLVDLEDDGELEVIGRSLLPNHVYLERHDGKLLDEVTVPLVACGC